jgi:hypothetical protein
MSAKINSTSTNEAILNAKDITGSTMAVSQTAARISFVASVASLVFLAALHILSPEFDPSWRMVSEYALGSYGWVLLLMFLAWAFSCVALFFAIRTQIKRIGGKIGLGFLLLAAVGMIMGGLFDVNHDLHGLAAMIGMPSLPIAAVLISVSLGRNPAWTSVRRSLLWTAILTWVSLILMNVAIFTGFSQTGEANPGAWFGWANRLLIIAYNGWLMAVAWWALHVRQSRSS